MQLPPLPPTLAINVPKLPDEVPAGKIRLYCVGIYFYNDIDFLPDPNVKPKHPDKFPPGTQFMSGRYILAAAAKAYGLRYSLGNTSTHVEFLSYTPQQTSPLRHPTSAPDFPYYGQELSLQEVQAPIGSVSNIFQYTCDKPVATALIDNPQFGVNGFQVQSEVRIRLLSIYDSASLYS